jgi:transcriptional regulator with XRE-family HTH domain
MKSEKHQGAVAETFQRVVAPELRQLRKQAGDRLKLRRADAGLSRGDITARLGLKTFTFISQIEYRLSRAPTETVAAWALAVRTVLVGCMVRHTFHGEIVPVLTESEILVQSAPQLAAFV